MVKDRIRVRLFPDFGADWPLWPEGLMNPSDLDLSDELVARVKAWQEYFDDHYDIDHGWPSPDHATAHVAEGTELQRLLTAEIGRCYEVELMAYHGYRRS